MIGDGQHLIDLLTARMDAERSPALTNGHASRPASTARSASPHTDEQVIEKCREAQNAAKFSDLYDHGDVHAHHGGDDSLADLGLLGMLRFYTQDAAQLERLFSASALGQREKWRRRRDYRERTIQKALSDPGEAYEWEDERSYLLRPRSSSSSSSPYIGSDDDDGDRDGHRDEHRPPKLELVTFATRAKPSPREFVVTDLIPRYHPTTLYGWGGTAKSLLAVLLGLTVAGGAPSFLGGTSTFTVLFCIWTSNWTPPNSTAVLNSSPAG